jgi:hypothetical protein
MNRFIRWDSVVHAMLCVFCSLVDRQLPPHTCLDIQRGHVCSGLRCCCSYLSGTSFYFSSSDPFPVLVLSCIALSYPILFTVHRTFQFPLKILPFSLASLMITSPFFIATFIIRHSSLPPSSSPLPHSSLFPSLPYTYPRSLNRPPVSL